MLNILNVFSLRLKIFLTLVIIPFSALTLFLYFLVDTFERDKATFIYELQDQSLKSLAIQIRDLLRDPADKSKVNALTANEAQLTKQVCEAQWKIIWNTFDPKTLKYWLCFADPQGEQVLEMRADLLLSQMNINSLFDTFLINGSGFIVADSSSQWIGHKIDEIYSGLVDLSKVEDLNGHFEAQNKKGERFLASFQRVRNLPLTVLAATPRTATQRAAIPFLVKGGVTLLVILGIVIVVGLIFSRQLTEQLKRVIKGLSEFGKGNVDYRVEVLSKDEAGKLAEGFNHMADEVRTLLRDRAEKAKVEAEMDLAAKLQQQFFPQPQNQFGKVSVNGHVEAAIQCGGDWWFVFETQQAIVIIVGDATGHGLGPAMVTGAARSALAQVEDNYLSPSNLLAILNKSIFETAKGGIQMTMCVIEVPKTGDTLRYASASHEPAVLIREGEEPELLLETHGPRLGEARNTLFGESEVQVPGKWKLWLYTDGVKDLESAEGKVFGDRRMLKIFGKGDLLEVIEQLNTFRTDAPLADDVTLVEIQHS